MNLISTNLDPSKALLALTATAGAVGYLIGGDKGAAAGLALAAGFSALAQFGYLGNRIAEIEAVKQSYLRQAAPGSPYAVPNPGMTTDEGY